MKILITGAAGFIGSHLSKLLSSNNHKLLGIDNLNEYYDLKLKKSRLLNIQKSNFEFREIDVSNFNKLDQVFKNFMPDIVIHLAAQAGVRYSIEKPYEYINSNLVGFFNILECCKLYECQKLLFASSSSIYGDSKKIKFSEKDFSDKPLNLYAASKKSNELMAFSYSNLFNLNCVGLRFFTVYGPWGRPDMMYFKFTKKILENEEIEIYGNGNMWRDFTYVDDVTDGIKKLLEVPNVKIFESQKYQEEKIPFRIFNIGNNKPENLNYFVEVLEKILGKTAKKKYMGMQPGDVLKTSADITEIQSITTFFPQTNIQTGLEKFVKWYKEFYY